MRGFFETGMGRSPLVKEPDVLRDDITDVTRALDAKRRRS
ncbi:hypothetical protein Salmuc_01163 [Salipiger mucosus DSM 16094]|uniref:Uncharacterized protein n=1 Tax=Salipiger mucosus DSM 16094 TaxID=1123237 RepID=S9Q7W8_9RHOB|nr:hypothetical protein Salmuc_01163 [Salipiger mucosus DSM 16094]